MQWHTFVEKPKFDDIKINNRKCCNNIKVELHLCHVASVLCGPSTAHDAYVHEPKASFTPSKYQFLVFFYFLLYIANYNLLNIDRVISKVEVREGREAGTIHRWFTGALLLG